MNVRKAGAVGGMLALAMMAGAAPVRAMPEHLEQLQKAGDLIPYEVIQRRMMQNPPGEYIGSQFDVTTKQYRFRFMRDGNVINVDVDARTGARVQRRQSF